MHRHTFLRTLHKVYRPRSYLEIGVNDGRSLALSRTPSIAVDPAFKITAGINCRVRLVREKSDRFFRRKNPMRTLPGGLVDLAFIDGMHLFEFALRDFINVEGFTRWSSVVVLDDMLPRDVDEAARQRHTGAWTGDVYKVAEVLEEHRPDLVCVPVDTRPTGVLVVLGLDATSSVLRERYEQIHAQHVVPDPQPVPDAVLERRGAVEPEAFLQAPFWADLVRARDSRLRHRRTRFHDLRPSLEQAVSGAQVDLTE